MTTDVVAGPAPAVEFPDSASRSAYLRWSAAMADRLRNVMPDAPTRREFVQTVWFESKRQGLDPTIALALIEQTSNFRRFFMSDTNSRGYMAVPAEWAKRIGDGDVAKLFHLQTNLRFGTVVLSRYASDANGDMHVALGRYLAESKGIPAKDPRVSNMVARLFALHAENWKYVE
ncbi:lytic transglycosylase domain-containing protein [Variovorax sp. Sphag1AA]|uniref:lytic transglycosylase domain-containing protein n=1 Tax=Variovorax sp. Sphag1AA TaxID=2587027 RepID=UPI00161CB3B6|nr:lytic transglycosylase domain-containing protein [Variovorax sp. Sphag1AA]MBB3182283.1 soluble lytic murein transglycosylase-like protein [Variovorax sp. Sphag1AA]